MLDLSKLETSPTLPPRVLLFGPYGGGKTHSLRTLLDLGLEVFIFFTENGMEVLSDTDPKRMHWMYIPAEKASFKTLLAAAENVNMYTYEALTQQKAGGNKQAYAQYITLLKGMMDFKCDRTGQSYGPINNFGPNKVVVIDSLSGLNIMIARNTVGDRAIPQIGEYRVMQDSEAALINAMCMGLNCGFVLMAHPDRAADELGLGAIYPSAMGTKLSPQLPRYFSDVVWTSKEGTKRYWSTSSPNINTKERNLPIGDKLEPSFVPLYTNWHERQQKEAPAEITT